MRRSLEPRQKKIFSVHILRNYPSQVSLVCVLEFSHFPSPTVSCSKWRKQRQNFFSPLVNLIGVLPFPGAPFYVCFSITMGRTVDNPDITGQIQKGRQTVMVTWHRRHRKTAALSKLQLYDSMKNTQSEQCQDFSVMKQGFTRNRQNLKPVRVVFLVDGAPVRKCVNPLIKNIDTGLVPRGLEEAQSMNIGPDCSCGQKDTYWKGEKIPENCILLLSKSKNLEIYNIPRLSSGLCLEVLSAYSALSFQNIVAIV